ncbi:hypothetical protein KIN20_021795 [Parelaphostrongylus tenuis]|uniref:Uncharacterized protein n=1 Tax=Parelaphostrongylus tenuis TaxID=148309 RepID=A0AAD5MUM5_PARTN|nr:hypothetical protein KIN20_021795 [Parelaphostrongylus tenuis]
MQAVSSNSYTQKSSDFSSRVFLRDHLKQSLTFLKVTARSVLLPDAIVSAILSQLTVRVSYAPLKAKNVFMPLL